MTTKIPIADIAAQYLSLQADIDAAVRRVLASGHFIGGPEVEAFEQEFAAQCGAGEAVSVASGTDALRFSLLATGDGGARARARDGIDEVVTSPLSFIATTEAISQAGARPVFADIDSETFTLDPTALEAAVTPRNRAGASLRAGGRHAAHPGAGAARRRGRGRGRLPGPRVARSWPCGRHARRCRLLLLLPHEEPGRLRRGRDGHDVAPRGRATHPAAQGPWAGGEIPAPGGGVQRSPGRPAGGDPESEAAASARLE